jgi:DNA-binding transcriptional ArsR family regulator
LVTELTLQPASQFAALSDATRCRIVALLSERARPVHELATAFDISRPAVSRHLRLLKEAGLVVEEKQGRENVYSLRRQSLKALSTWLESHWSERLVILKRMAEATVSKQKMEIDL